MKKITIEKSVCLAFAKPWVWSTAGRELGAVVRAFNPSSWKEETRGS